MEGAGEAAGGVTTLSDILLSGEELKGRVGLGSST